MAAILKEDVHESLVSTPPALERIVARCLEKTREARFQSARDLAFALEGLSGTSGTAARAAARARPRRWRTAAGVVAMCLLTAVAGWLIRYTTFSPTEDAFFKAAPFTLLTDWDGTEGNAEISQDGKFVAFMADKSGALNLWWSQIGGRPQNLTPNFQVYGAVGINRHVGFSGDGNEVWFSTRRGAEDALMIMHVTGESPRPFLGKNAEGPAWSRDNKHLVFFRNQPTDPLFIADGAGNNAQEIDIKPDDRKEWFGVGDLDDIKVHNHNPVWSTDDKWIYFVHGIVYELNWTDEMDVWRIRPAGGAPERLTHHGTAVTFIAPLDERTLLYTARAEDGSGPWVWELDVVTRATRRLGTGLEQYTSVAASADGRSVVATRANPTASLWTVPIPSPGRQSVEGDVRPYDVQRTRALAPRFGNTEASLFFLSSRGIGDELWRFQDGQASEIRRFTDAALSEPAAVSPDGRRLVLSVRQSSKQHLLIMSADGTESHPLAPSIETRGTADWSPGPNAEWVVTGGRDAEGPALFKIPVAGGAPLRIVPRSALNPQWSPDGTLIVYSGPIVAGSAPLLAVRPDRTPVDLSNVVVRPNRYRFLPDGKGLVYQASRDFWCLDLVTRETRQLTNLDNRGRLLWFDITPDSKHIVFDRWRENSDIVLIERPKKQDLP
jgi:Tol biopolymer transport system component